MNVADNPCVFVHGFLGSFLKDSTTGKTVFCSLWQGLGRQPHDLSMPLLGQANADTIPESSIVADGIFDYLRLWGIKLKAIYGPLIDGFSKRSRPFSAFVYDWREDLNVTSRQLETYLDKVSAQHGGKKVQVIAHSMGGMLTYPILKRRPEIFESVLFCGAPFSAGISFLPDFHRGLGLGISAQMLFTFRSAYAFFPSLEHGYPSVDGNIVDFYDPEVWISNGLGIFQDGHSPTAEEYVHLQSVLRAARVYRSLCDAAPDDTQRQTPWPPTSYVIGNAVPTLRMATSVTKNQQKRWNFDTSPSVFLPGDGRLFFSIGSPPESHGITPHRVVETKLGHMELVTNNVPQLLFLCDELSEAAQRQ